MTRAQRCFASHYPPVVPISRLRRLHTKCSCEDRSLHHAGTGTSSFPDQRRARVFKAFQYRDFRLMWIGACTSSIGTWMQIVAQGWLIYRLSHSARLLGLDQFLAGLPIFLFYDDRRSGGRPRPSGGRFC